MRWNRLAKDGEILLHSLYFIEPQDLDCALWPIQQQNCVALSFTTDFRPELSSENLQ